MKHKGFSLVEVAAIVALLGVLAAIAYPAYQLYTTRAKVAEGFALSGPAKTGVALFHQTNGKFPDNNETAGVADEIRGTYVAAVDIGPEGKITISYMDDGGPPLDGQNVELTPQPNGGAIYWDCDSGSIPPRFLPPECRHVEVASVTMEPVE